jgi:hypothetical protein
MILRDFPPYIKTIFEQTLKKKIIFVNIDLHTK